MDKICSVVDCPSLIKSSGMCNKHSIRTRKYGDPSRGRKSPEERFWSKVNKTDTCWLWMGALNKGYGYISVGYLNIRAHRFAYELLVGPIPDGLVLDHVKSRGCENRHCVNPNHLEPVTDKENVLRGIGITAKNSVKTHCLNGHPLNGDNLYLSPQNRRFCRICKDATLKRSRKNRKERGQDAALLNQ